MPPTSRSPGRQRMQRQGTLDSLVNQGLKALDQVPQSPYNGDWRHLLEKLEALQNASPGAKQSIESNGVDYGFPMDGGGDDLPTRILREAVAYLQRRGAASSSVGDVEATKLSALASQVKEYCRKSMLSTATTSSSHPSVGSSSSLSIPVGEQDFPSPSPLKFTFTRTSTNSFALDVFPDDISPQPPVPKLPSPRSPTTVWNDSPSRYHHARMRSETVPKPVPVRGRTRSTSVREAPFSGIVIDENASYEGSSADHLPLRIPVGSNGPKPAIKPPSKHRHSRSLPQLRVETKSASPPLPPAKERTPNSASSDQRSLRHSQSMNAFIHHNHLFLGGAYIPATKSSKRSTSKSSTKGDPNARWTIHDRDSWEVVPPVPPTKSPRHVKTPLPHTPLPEQRPTPPSKPRGLERLRKRLSKSNLSIKTGALSSITNITSPKLPDPIPFNVNAVVLGPSVCGVSTLIRKFMSIPNEWIPSSTIDEFWHHVVTTESRKIYYNITEVTGTEEYVDLRRAVLRRAQVVILCFRLDSRQQFRDAIVRLVEDIHTIGDIPIILAGTFQDSPHRQVSADEAQTAAEALHATYVECSPLLGRGVQDLFERVATVLQAADHPPPPLSATTSQPPSATKTLFNLVRGRRSFSNAPSSHSRSKSHYVPHSASALQVGFGHSSHPPVSINRLRDLHSPSLLSIPPVLNIAPNASVQDLTLKPPPIHFKTVFHGAHGSGKKSLVHRYLHGSFEWLPEVPWMTWKAAVNLQPSITNWAQDYERIRNDHERRPSLPINAALGGVRLGFGVGMNEDGVSSIPYALSISECRADKALDELRRATYKDVGVWVICFSVSDYREEVMTEIRERWYAETQLQPSIPVILVGTKIDERTGTLRVWTTQQGHALARSIKAAAYLECSAATGEGVEEVFKTVVKVANEAQTMYRP